LNETLLNQSYIDYRTSWPTFITGELCGPEQWKGVVELNRTRSRNIKEAAEHHAQGESISLDVWTASFEGRCQQFKVPLVSLESFGFFFNDIHLLASKDVQKLNEGKEASAWLDKSTKCVYKLFDLRANGKLGEKLVLEMRERGECEAVYHAATLSDTLDKLQLLNAIGACPTEIVGLTTSGDYLIAKQPLCQPYTNFEESLEEATEFARAVRPKSSFQQPVWVFWARQRPWLLGDLHPGNIRHTANGYGTIIDAHIGVITDEVWKEARSLDSAIQRAKLWRETGKLPSDDLFESIDDNEL